MREFYASYYEGQPFVEVVNEPSVTKQALRADTCAVYPTVDTRTELACRDKLHR